MRRRALRPVVDAVVIGGFAIVATMWTLEMSRPSIGFAFGINWALMGLAFAVWLVVPARLGAWYYRVHPVERSGRLYEALGVRTFQRVLRASGLHAVNPFLRYRRGPDAAASLVAATESSETAHLLIFLVLGVVSAALVQRGWWSTGGWLLVFNVLHNAYPVMSLRHVRARCGGLTSGSRSLSSAHHEATKGTRSTRRLPKWL